MNLAREVYVLTRRFPREEIYGLTAQLRRAAVSIPSNIAEGNGRQRRRDYIRFLLVARGSLQELETQLLLAMDLAYVTEEAVNVAILPIAEISRMLTALVRSLGRLGQSPSN